MAIRKLRDGRWLCECYPTGRKGRRIRKHFVTKGEAQAFERYTLEILNDKPWLGEVEDRRTLTDLIKLWFNLHGQSLSAGVHTYRKLLLIAQAMNNPIASHFTARDFAHYREHRLSGQLRFSERYPNGVQPITVNLEHSLLHSVFSELIRLGEWLRPNPLTRVRRFVLSEKEMAWLTHKQIAELLHHAAQMRKPDLSLLIRICLATGSRWREAEKLTRSQVSPYQITYVRTKGKKNRSIPISKALYDEIDGLQREKLFSTQYGAFRQLLKKTSITLPSGQLTHVLRHTFATHFMMNGGNILVLQRILGHYDIKMTMKYAHFAPDHLDTALQFNPLNGLTYGDKVATQSGNTPSRP